MTKTILLITSPFRPNIGGVETHLDDLIDEGSKRGLRFRVITYQPLVTNAKGKYVERNKNHIVYRIPWPRFNLFLKLEKLPAFEFLYLFPGLFLGGLIYLIFNHRNTTTIHGQGLAAGTAGIFLAKIFRKKVILSTHSIYNFPQKGMYLKFVKLFFSWSDKILTLSEQSKREVEKLGVEPSKISVFTYWVDQAKFKPVSISKRKALRQKLHWQGKFVVLFVGRLVSVKGVEELLGASEKLKKGVVIAFVGDGPLAPTVKQIANKKKNIIFIGSIYNDKISDYYNSADVLIIPSTHEEGFGRVIIEALSCGLPVIGSKRGAIPEAMNETVGYFVNVTSDNIAKVINLVSKNKNELARKSKRARAFAVKKYSGNNIDQIIEYYS